MTKRALTLTSAALALALAGSATAQSDEDANIAAQASDAAGEIADTVYAIGETATDTAQAGIGAVGDVAEQPYGGAANISAQLDAALTGDAVVRSTDGEIIGTVSRTDRTDGHVIIDLDGEMEGADDRAIENAAVPIGAFSATETGLVVNMSADQFATALQSAPERQMGADG
ncbi:hypothetical protein [Roseivivax isoporae]|uniref:PRC-barrel domain-containing protein n=1 Tax=Roseivivax isoporae LMG 25204 TaxID=1449351 RepID=X7FAR4_9RHOB|nr:hypothetical protein [Roseivivax isoporae]ETX29169.1 hypothetical protein RISW2_02540 [Roseivivax isoporae LMG 25204]